MSGVTRILCGSLLIVLLLFCGCYPGLRREARDAQEAMRPVRFFYPSFHDDMPLSSLARAIRENLSYLYRLDPETPFQYGPHRFTCREVRGSQEAFLKLIEEDPGQDRLNQVIQRDFLVYRAAGKVGDDQVLFTGYFEPVFQASLTPDHVFKYPLYRRPEDLLRIDLSPFSERLEGESIVARIDGNRVIPYHSRCHIEGKGVLRGRGLEIAWLKDPVDVAFLQIQGSGKLRLADGRIISVGYDGSNGRPYRSIGRYMLKKGYLSRDEISMQRIRAFLSAHPEMVQEVLNHNPSYVFFRTLEEGPLGSLGVPLTPGRSLALDSSLFPKGALAFISCVKPLLNNRQQIREWKRFSRFVMNQDTGGAIKGAGRADLFWGRGPYAEMAAGHLKHEGRLYILIKKP